tara:strand:- start:1736 stop:3532 length:1797 start_codon:yes stop_codon:yes gene_type:complete
MQIINLNKKNISLLKIISKIYKEISLKRKYQFVFQIFIMVLSGFCEFISLASVLPFLTVISKPEVMWNVLFLKDFFNFMGFNNPKDLIIPISLLFIIVSIFTAVIRIFNIWISGHLSAAVGSDLSKKAFQKTLLQPYSFHINKNSSELINANTIQVDKLIIFITSVLLFISSFLIVLFILVGLLIVDWKIALISLLTFLTCYLILSFTVKKRLRRNSNFVSSYGGLVIKAIQESLGSIRETIINNNQDTYTNIFEKYERPMRRFEAQSRFLASSPRYAFEVLGISLIAIMALIISIQKDSIVNVLPIIGTFALAGQKLLPAMQQMYGAWAEIGSNSVAVEKVLFLLNQDSKIEKIFKSKNKFVLKEEIQLNDVSFKYPGNNKYVLKNINLTIKKGDCIGIIGSTGSGKSTLVDLVMSLLEPSSGKILVDGKDLFDKKSRINLFEWRKNLSHVPQNIFLTDNSFAENIAFGCQIEDISLARVKKAAKIACIDNFIIKLPNKYLERVGERGIKLSGGQLQRLGIARSIYKNSSLLILDEATSALDTLTESKIMESLNKLKSRPTIIMISHRLKTLLNCKYIVEIKNNKISRILKGKELNI